MSALRSYCRLFHFTAAWFNRNPHAPHFRGCSASSKLINRQDLTHAGRFTLRADRVSHPLQTPPHSNAPYLLPGIGSTKSYLTHTKVKILSPKARHASCHTRSILTSSPVASRRSLHQLQLRNRFHVKKRAKTERERAHATQRTRAGRRGCRRKEQGRGALWGGQPRRCKADAAKRCRVLHTQVTLHSHPTGRPRRSSAQRVNNAPRRAARTRSSNAMHADAVPPWTIRLFLPRAAPGCGCSSVVARALGMGRGGVGGGSNGIRRRGRSAGVARSFGDGILGSVAHAVSRWYD